LKAKEMILSSEQRLSGQLFISLRQKLFQKNPVLMEFIVKQMTEKHKDVGAWDRSIDMAAIGLVILGATDEGEEDSNYVRVSEESVALAKEKKIGIVSLLVDIAECDTEIGADIDEALRYVEGYTEVLNTFDGKIVVDAEEAPIQSVIFFHAYWLEYKKNKGL
jgi:hypothetical protein